MKNRISYIRQTDLFNPINQKYNIVMLGAGSLGSFITLNLAKLGFENISVYDFDIVTSYNLPNQFFRIQDVGKKKVVALKEIVKDFADIDITIFDEKVTNETLLPVGLNTVFILTFDSLQERKKIFEMLKVYEGGYVMDARCGGEGYNLQLIDLHNEDEMKQWEKSFEGEPTPLPCGAKSIIYTNLNLASEVCNIIKKLNNDEERPTRFFRHMKGYRIIQNQGIKKENNLE